MTRLIDAWKLCEYANNLKDKCVDANDIMRFPAEDAVPVIRCKDCKYQEKYYHEDRRRKDGGYYIYGCELADGYSHVCLDDDFCSRAEREESCIQEQ